MVRRRHREGGPNSPTSEAHQTVTEVYHTFERLRRRHTRLGRLVRRREANADDLAARRRGRPTTAAAREQAGYNEAWSRWSASYDEVAAAADGLLRGQARSLSDVIMMFAALEWMLLSDQVIVDRDAERSVRRFGRELRRLAADVEVGQYASR
jgi:hypothetical protein